jgi:hypothetical protein
MGSDTFPADPKTTVLLKQVILKGVYYEIV